MVKIKEQLDSMHWFSHQHSSAPKDRSRKECRLRTTLRGRIPNKMLHFVSFWPRRPWPLTLTFKLRGKISVQCN